MSPSFIHLIRITWRYVTKTLISWSLIGRPDRCRVPCDKAICFVTPRRLCLAQHRRRKSPIHVQPRPSADLPQILDPVLPEEVYSKLLPQVCYTVAQRLHHSTFSPQGQMGRKPRCMNPPFGCSLWPSYPQDPCHRYQPG